MVAFAVFSFSLEIFRARATKSFSSLDVVHFLCSSWISAALCFDVVFSVAVSSWEAHTSDFSASASRRSAARCLPLVAKARDLS